jgi:RNA polymerase sigma factor for flagellar operon FliA
MGGRCQRVALDAMQTELVAAQSTQPDKAYAQVEQQMLLKAQIEALTPREQLVINLYWQQELNMAEIASLLNISPDNAYSLKYRLITKLRKRLHASIDSTRAS